MLLGARNSDDLDVTPSNRYVVIWLVCTSGSTLVSSVVGGIFLLVRLSRKSIEMSMVLDFAQMLHLGIPDDLSGFSATVGSRKGSCYPDYYYRLS